MAGGLPIMRAYRPASKPKSVQPVPMAPTTAFRPAPLDTNSQRADWIHESKEWSRILAQTIEHRRQHQIEVEKAQDRAKYLPILRQQQQAQEKAQAEYDARIAELTSYKRMWVISCAGLVLSGFLFLTLPTNVLRDTKGAQLGSNTTCELVPSLTDGSIFSVVYWTAVAVYIISRLAAPMAAANVAALSEGLSRADAAYYGRQNEYALLVNSAGAATATFTLGWYFVLMVRGKCEGEICLNVALAAPLVMSWFLLAFIVGVLFLESGYRVIVGQWKRVSNILSSKEELREAVGKRGSELLSQDEKDTLEWV